MTLIHINLTISIKLTLYSTGLTCIYYDHRGKMFCINNKICHVPISSQAQHKQMHYNIYVPCYQYYINLLQVVNVYGDSRKIYSVLSRCTP